MNKMDRADCPVFRPSRKDMSRSFEKYIESIEQECLPFGICKITAAKGWTPCAQGYIGQDLEWEISRIEQVQIVPALSCATLGILVKTLTGVICLLT